MIKANQDLWDYMADHGVTQGMLSAEAGVPQWKMSTIMKRELSQADKEMYLNMVDAIAHRVNEKFAEEVLAEEPEETEDVTCSPKFQIGDRVKIPAKAETIGIVTDIWSSMAQGRAMYEVAYESNGNKALYAEDQLELAPVPISFSWEAHIDGNVAVCTMTATQGEKSWVYSRGHAHIIHDGEVGMAQAISYAARRMFENLDAKQENKIYVRGAV